jgi:prepilin-type N-terminal cleavage/methylation domain-containing protein
MTDPGPSVGFGAPGAGVSIALGIPVRTDRGFTLFELIIAVTVSLILAVVAYTSLARNKPRANLMSSATELEAVLRNARQNALSTGHDTVVMVFPQQQNQQGGTGTVIALELTTTTATTFFGATAPNFATFDPTKPANEDNLLGKLDLPSGITFGLGGFAPPVLDVPYKAITTGACSFCDTGSDGRGAVVFDTRGRASFFPTISLFGGTIGLQGTPQVEGYRLIIISRPGGSVRVLANG